jgi:MFS transporter, AAHS family, 4-hydroxybenzoate transporter
MPNKGQTVDVATLIEDQKLGWLQYTIIFWLCVFMLLEGYDMQVIGFAAPAIIHGWHITKASFGPVISANVVGYIIGSLMLGTVGDRFGRKKVLICGTLVFGLFTVAAAFSTSLGQLLSLRVLAGIGLGGAVPTGIALAAEYTPHRMRATIIGLMFVGYTIGASLGGFIGALVIPAYGWPSVFLIGGLATFPLCLILAFVLPESIRFLALTERSPELIAALARKLRPGQDFPAGTQYVVTEAKRLGLPVINLFRDGRAIMTTLLWVAYIASLAGHYFLTGWLPTVLSDAGLTIKQANVAGGLLQLGGGVGSILVGVLLDRAGIKVVVLSFLLAIPFVASLGIITGPGPLLYAVVTIAGCCVLGGQIGLNALSGISYPTSIRATGSGWALGVGRIGSIIGPIVGGVLITMGLSRSTLFMWSATPFLLSAVAMLILMMHLKGGRTHAMGVLKEEAAVLKGN